MPALTRRRKRQLPWDLEEDEDRTGDEMLGGILAQRAQRREAARAQEEEQTGNRVSSMMFSHVFLVYN